MEAGALLVALDVSVEEAELEAQAAEAGAGPDVARSALEGLSQHQAVSQEEVDQARAERDVALAQMARTRAIIARKTIRAPFRARVGMADVHPGQYLNEGTELTTLQGVADDAHVDFTVRPAGRRRPAAWVDAWASSPGATSAPSLFARIVAIDARVDPATRNAMVRARIARGQQLPSPGASVRVLVPSGRAGTDAVAVPVSALRKGPGRGPRVRASPRTTAGKPRAHVRAGARPARCWVTRC